MAEQYVSEIRLFPFNFAPKGWASCDGQLLPIAQNQELFSLLGTNYGGDGQTNFALPDLRGAVGLHGGGSPTVGTKGGAAQVALTLAQIPSHTHAVTASSNPASVADPSNAYWAATSQAAYASTSSQSVLAPQAIANMGGGQGHENMGPYLALNYCIALTGIYPSRS